MASANGDAPAAVESNHGEGGVEKQHLGLPHQHLARLVRRGYPRSSRLRGRKSTHLFPSLPREAGKWMLAPPRLGGHAPARSRVEVHGHGHHRHGRSCAGSRRGCVSAGRGGRGYTESFFYLAVATVVISIKNKGKQERTYHDPYQTYCKLIV